MPSVFTVRHGTLLLQTKHKTIPLRDVFQFHPELDGHSFSEVCKKKQHSNKTINIPIKLRRELVRWDQQLKWVLTILTQENRLLAIGVRRAEDLSIPQVLVQHDGQPRLVEGLHDNGAHSLVVGEEVEHGEDQKEAESQAALGRDTQNEGHLL